MKFEHPEINRVKTPSPHISSRQSNVNKSALEAGSSESLKALTPNQQAEYKTMKQEYERQIPKDKKTGKPVDTYTLKDYMQAIARTR